jgi:hydrogenase/urease accessory protein HupE
MSWLRYVVALLTLLVSTLSWSHESRPAFFQLTELAPTSSQTGSAPGQRYRLKWMLPQTLPSYTLPSLRLPDQCQDLAPPSERLSGRTYSGQTIFHCDSSIQGQPLTIEFPDHNPSVSSLVNLTLANGERLSQLFKPGQTLWLIPQQPTSLQVAKQYTRAGIDHIWKGVDHLLFVACLILVAHSPRRIVITITGFTLAHSITLALATLGWARVPIAPVESVIALSILFLAHEICLERHQSWTFRYPVTVSASFGLLHGFGFASVLSELDLPQSELVTALLAFNIGVEIGQLLFIALVLAALWAGSRILPSYTSSSAAIARLRILPIYSVGMLAGYWFIERLAAFWA